ncbi:hypothetical protein BGX34_006471 [Mortierella sp. NVP85]|nr:hypothetical protein BGX34_006471 [Mortierella sp. NVP85]
MSIQISRISIAKAVLIACALGVVVTFLQISFAVNFNYRYNPWSISTSSPTQIEVEHQNPSGTVQQPQPSLPIHHGVKKDKKPRKPKLRKQKSHNTPSPSPSPVPRIKTPSPPNEDRTFVYPDRTIRETRLTTSTRFRNGTVTKVFKPAFFKDAKAAKEEMGSFMLTLAERSQRVRTLEQGHGQMNDNSTDCHEETLSDKLDRGRYFAYLPMGGGNNQLLALQKAALIAKDLNRTLILPPISPNMHVPTWAGPRYSEFYDLDAFMIRSGISVIEWHDIKQTPEQVLPSFRRHWREFSEDLPCVPNGGMGAKTVNLLDRFRAQFLFNYKNAMSQADTTHGKSRSYGFARDVLLKDVTPSSPVERTFGGLDPNMWRCLTSPYYLYGKELNHRPWEEVGMHLRFNDRIEALVDDLLDVLLGPAEKVMSNKASLGSPESKPFRSHPEFITIHLRRGDIVNKCPRGMAENECVVQIEAIAKKIDEIERARRMQALVKHRRYHSSMEGFVHKRLPVLVATNEKREEELLKIQELGWILVDHGDEVKDIRGNIQLSRTIKLGTYSRFGPWYPPMLDAVLLTRANYMIGMRRSVMSGFGSNRGAAWHGHRTILL